MIRDAQEMAARLSLLQPGIRLNLNPEFMRRDPFKLLEHT
ncbi:hypothetical protein PVOR_05048 [Paenibacillus vortex V453]|uniref:Uncharacterized protein n=1 Tax=Paenibacillus vortex V453 TaxID=715225 RepID=A0A2R9T0H7_9BACL|nr:hypothetical protein PVOR_05048 [Paenibacillus vortex V453]